MGEPGRLTATTLRGIWAGITLSWHPDYLLDEISLRENLLRLCAAGVHGIYTTGSTGEFYALDWPEFQHVVDIVMEVVPPSSIPVQIGCCADDTRDVIRQVEYAVERGADGLQVTLPYWMELTDHEVVQFFADVALASCGVPLIHYNIPRAKRYLTGPDYCRVLEVAPNLIGVKFTFAGSHFAELQEALHVLPGLSFFVAEDFLASAMQLGARGCYSSLVCAYPRFMLKLYDLATAREWDQAMAMQAVIVRLRVEAGPLLARWDLGGIDPVFDKGLAVASGYLIGHQRTRPPYIGWSDSGLAQFRAWLKERFSEFANE